MQSKRLIMSLFLLLSMTALSAWGAEEQTLEAESGSDDSLQPSNIEGWEEEELETPLTFFGMGFESRNPGVAQHGGAPGHSNAGSSAAGGYAGGRKK